MACVDVLLLLCHPVRWMGLLGADLCACRHDGALGVYPCGRTGPLHGRAFVLVALVRHQRSKTFPNGDEGVQEGRCLVLQDTPSSCTCPSCASSSQAATLHWLVSKPPTASARSASGGPVCTYGACSSALMVLLPYAEGSPLGYHGVHLPRGRTWAALLLSPGLVCCSSGASPLTSTATYNRLPRTMSR